MNTTQIGWRHSFLLAVLLALLVVHAGGVCLDFAAAIRDPLELDYGEGIVWQQSLLVPGPSMYSASTGLPFIVFHYPPLFYLAVRVARWFEPDVLAAGRLVSILSTLMIIPSIAGLVLVAAGHSGPSDRGWSLAMALACGLLALSLHALRSWGMVMRVDMIAIALSMAGLLVAAVADGRFWGTTLALLLCAAGLFGKQTELPSGIAVFLLAALRSPRNAFGAAAIAGAVAFAVLIMLQRMTGGGFLQNVIGYNINRFTLGGMFWALWPERPSLPVIILIGIAFVSVGWQSLPSTVTFRATAVMQDVLRLRNADRSLRVRGLLIAHLTLSSAMLFTAMKSGSSFNYMLDWLCVGCALLGVFLVDLVRSRVWNGWRFDIAATVLIVAVSTWPVRAMPDRVTEPELRAQEALVQAIAAAEKPVGSENMTLLMRAGKPVLYEPSIVTELASVGRWNEAPLVALIRAHGLAFMLTTDDRVGGSLRRSPAVDAAMREVFPKIELVGPKLWLHASTD